MCYTGRKRSVKMDDMMRKDLDRLVEILREEWGDDLVSVVLFGSQVTGNARDESDIDVLIVRDGFPAGRLTRRREFDALSVRIPPLHRTLSTVLLRPAEAAVTKPFYLDMTIASELLYDKDGFFAGVLARLKRRMDELGTRRAYDVTGAPYWVLKPDAKFGEEIVL